MFFTRHGHTFALAHLTQLQGIGNSSGRERPIVMRGTNCSPQRTHPYSRGSRHIFIDVQLDAFTRWRKPF